MLVGKQVTNLLILSYVLPLFWGLHKYNSVVFVLSFTCYSLVLPILYLTCQYIYISMHCKGRGTYFKNKYLLVLSKCILDELENILVRKEGHSKTFFEGIFFKKFLPSLLVFCLLSSFYLFCALQISPGPLYYMYSVLFTIFD